MREAELGCSLKGVSAVVAWDIDGGLCYTSALEKMVDKAAPALIPGVQRFFQSSRGFFVSQRQRIGNGFLSKRKLNDEAVHALINSYQEKEILAKLGIIVKNVIATERPRVARHFIFDQLQSRVAFLQQSQPLDREINVEHLVEGYWDNPPGGDHTRVKPDIAAILQEQGVKFYLLEDKVHTARLVKRTAPDSSVYILTNSRGGQNHYPDNLIPVNSPSEFVNYVYTDIQARIPVNTY